MYVCCEIPRTRRWYFHEWNLLFCTATLVVTYLCRLPALIAEEN